MALDNVWGWGWTAGDVNDNRDRDDDVGGGGGHDNDGGGTGTMTAVSSCPPLAPRVGNDLCGRAGPRPTSREGPTTTTAMTVSRQQW